MATAVSSASATHATFLAASPTTGVVATATPHAWYLKENGEPSTLLLVIVIHAVVLTVIITTIFVVRCCCCRQKRMERRERMRIEQMERIATFRENNITAPISAPVAGESGYFGAEAGRAHGNTYRTDETPTYDELPPQYTAKPKN